MRRQLLDLAIGLLGRASQRPLGELVWLQPPKWGIRWLLQFYSAEAFLMGAEAGNGPLGLGVADLIGRFTVWRGLGPAVEDPIWEPGGQV